MDIASLLSNPERSMDIASLLSNTEEENKETIITSSAEELQELKNLQAAFNRNTPRKRKTTETFTIEDKKERDEEEDDGLHAIEEFVSVDPVTGHVLVKWDNTDGEMQWVPFVYLRWACPSLRNKKELCDTVERLRSKPIVHSELPRTPIQKFHSRIRLLFYIPALASGGFSKELVVYKIFGKATVGVTTLDLISKGPELDQFVATKKAEIAKAGSNKKLLARIMGLHVKHHDLMPQFDADRMLANFPAAPASVAEENLIIGFLAQLINNNSAGASSSSSAAGFNIPSPVMPSSDDDEEV